MAAFFLGRRMVPYLVCQFAKPTLSNLIKECFGDDFPDIFNKQQVNYIYTYLHDLGAQTVLLELEYIDKDYLEDYARYYVRRFNSSGHKCGRLHFFATKLEHSDLDKLIAGQGTKKLLQLVKNNYLGFMVIKPLPKTFIGKTCLKTYRSINAKGTGSVCLTRRYQVNLFGIDLIVESIAMQEQDKIVSACATTAIWSALHALSWRSQREIPACSEITINAINHISGSTNSFPKKELSNKQILRALDVEGLRHHNEFAASINIESFFTSVKTYIDSGLPILLGVDVFRIEGSDPLIKVGGHAVTVLGYKCGSKTEPGNALYLHDDRLGPFARATFVELEAYKPPLDVRSTWGLVLQRRSEKGKWERPHEVLLPDSIIVPMHKKVRLPPAFAINTCTFIVQEFEQWLDEKFPKFNQRKKGRLNFSIKLEEISRIKTKIFSAEIKKNPGGISPFNVELTDADITFLRRQRASFLETNYARFQWAAAFSFGTMPAFKIFFDATEIPQGSAISAIFYENFLAAELVLQVFRQYAKSESYLEAPVVESFYLAFLRFLRARNTGLEEFLDKQYGTLRAPRYLRSKEVQNLRAEDVDSVHAFYGEVENTIGQELPNIKRREIKDEYFIWAIAHDGALLIGQEANGNGHPALTGFKPARIAGELWKDAGGWKINSKSGRYSGDYENPNEHLASALKKFQSIFPKSRAKISMVPYNRGN